MKNLNLIKRLWTDSHEKQSPQRFARYAAMLIMLLTLGVGQMWGASYTVQNEVRLYVDNSASNWTYSCRYVALGWANDGKTAAGGYSLFGLSAITNTKLLVYQREADYGNCYDFCLFGATSSWGGNGGTYDNMKTHGANVTQRYTLTGDLSYQASYLIVPAGTGSKISPTAITVTQAGTGSTSYTSLNSTQTIKYAVSGNGTYSELTSGTVPATITATSYKFVSTYNSVSSNNLSQTLTAGGSNYSATVTAARTATTTLTVSSVNSGYTFKGWYDAASGGNQLSASNTYTSYPTAARTIYARFEKKFTVTVNNDGNGSTSPSGAQSNIGELTGVSLSTTPNDGKEFSSWEIVSGTGSFQSSTGTSSNKFFPTSAATIRANFRSNRALTVAAGSHISSVTGSTDPVTLGTKYAITATPESGYSFSTWTASPAANATFDNASSASTNVTVANGSVTVTASATEIMRTITISGGTVYGGSATTTTAGVVTSAKVTANAPAAGKKFTGWTLGSGVSLKAGSSLTDRTIEIYSTANATVTATYADRASVKMYFAKPSGWSKVYAYAWKDGGTNSGSWTDHEMTSYETAGCVNYYYYLYYTEADGIGGAATGNSTWNKVIFHNGSSGAGNQTADLAISKGHYYYKADSEASSGRAAALASAWLVKGSFNSWGETDALTPNCGANTATKTISLTTGNKTFKIYNIVNDQWWRIDGNISATKSATTMINGDGDMTLTSSVAGNYTFTVGSTNSTPTLAVTYPTSYTLTYSIGSVAGTSGSISTSPSTSSGSKVLSGNTVTLTAPAAKAGYSWNGWYTNAAGTGGKIPDTDRAITVTMNADKTLYACYTQDDYTITLEGNGGTGHTASVTAHYDEYAPVDDGNGGHKFSIINPVKSGYTFAGWYTNSDGTGTMLISPDGYLTWNIDGFTDASGKWIATMGTNLYARWKTDASVNAYNFQYGSGTYYSSNWTLLNFGAADANNMRTVDWTLIDPTDKKFYVGYGGDFWTAGINGATGTSEEKDLSALRLAPGTLSVGTATGAVGKLVIFDNSSADNLYVGFQPNGYGLTYAGGTKAFSKVGDNMWQTDIVTLTTADVAGTFKVGLATASSYVDCSTMTATDNAAALNTRKNALVSQQSYPAIPDLAAGQEGRFVIWDNDSHAGQQWYLSFLPVYSITYNANGAETGSVPTDANKYRTNETPAVLGNSGNLAKQGYAFSGWNTAADGKGTPYAAGDNLAKIGSNVVLYAQFEKAEITALGLSETVIAPNKTITVTPTIEPIPVGPTKVCYELQYSNGTRLPSQPTFTPGEGNDVSFPVPSASATYIIQAKLAKGSTCPANSADVLSTRTTTFQVAGAHTVTIRYQDSDGRTLQASASIEASPLNWTTDGDITPPTITGYTFARWDAGDGVSIKNGVSDPVTTTTTPSIQIKAVYDGTLTAVYNKKKMVYFNNTLNWDTVYVYFYNNASNNKYWADGYGTGANKNQEFSGNKPFWEMHYGGMKRVAPGSNIWYFDWVAEGWSESEISSNITFANVKQALDVASGDNSKDYFHNAKVVFRQDYNNRTSLPMFVPLTSESNDFTSTTGSKYYSNGYWMNYPENTGYSLLIYNQTAKDGATKLYEIPFEFTDDFTMPMELVVDLEAGKTYGFEIKRADSKYYSNTGTMTANTTNWAMTKDQSSYCGLRTTAAGSYTFNFFYNGEYRIGVTYPVAKNDYRIVYTDVATWSKDAHTASWSHPSRVITKNSSATETKKDTVSFFWSYGSTPAIKYQKCTGTGTGSVTWNAGTSIDVSSFSSVLKKTGVYNFIFEQSAGGASISLMGVEPYTGNYYIRTDCAGSTKWSNFRSLDHQMTYSDYAEVNSGYSHYYTHWVTNGTNVKFCIANDYSMCITDTLVEDKGTVIANITAEGNDGAGRLNSASANIRFMWNQATNKISRAYIGGSTNISERFLVLEGDAKMYDENGNPLNITGLNPNEANLIDDQNFVYEREIQVNTKARAKLTAKYNTNIQYFKGSEGAFAEETTIELLGGAAEGKHTMRIVYDFKTNRLVTAYVPSGTINADIAINADLMIVREHQGEGQQLLFGVGGALSEVHTVYGVMRFNRWTLNNKEKTTGHSPVGDPKSIYERSLYWISFPFNVNLSDVFGFGTYGVDWIIEYYDGAERAANGYWIDSEGFWKMVMPAQRANFTLEAGKGYVLAIDVDAMKDNNTTFWANNIEQVELFFPSATNVENITQTTAHTIVPEHECTIDRRTDKSVYDTNKDRTKADSHWNMIGVPSYANYGATLTSDEAGTQTITWNSDPYTNNLPFLYEWNMTDDSYTVQSGTNYPFKAMHAYMVQYHGDLYWSLASATPTPSPIVARRAYAEKTQNAEFRLELQQNEKMVDQTFVNMKDAEEISAGFKFDEDLCKEFNAGKANIYTLIENYLPAAGNTLPMSEQTTLVPVGVKTTAAGEYTFAMPEGTNGVSVVLIDNIAGMRTNLALSDYTVALGKGDLSDRFMLEIAPIKQMPTDIENVQGDNVHSTKVRKVMVDGILYIVKDGKVFDARGAKVK